MLVITACGLFQGISSGGDLLSEEGGCLPADAGPDNPGAVEQVAKLKLPPSTTNLFAHSTAFQDCFVFVSFEMHPDELDEFLTSTSVTALDSVIGSELTYFINLMGDKVNWAFDSQATYLYGEGSSDDNFPPQLIVVDPSDPTLYKVYMIALLV